MRKPFTYESGFIKDSTHKKILEITEKHICEYPSHKKILEFDDEYVMLYPSHKKILYLDRDNIKEYPSHKKIATIDDVFDLINGDGGIELVAAWSLLES